MNTLLLKILHFLYYKLYTGAANHTRREKLHVYALQQQTTVETLPMKFTLNIFLCNPAQSYLNPSISICTTVSTFIISHYTHH